MLKNLVYIILLSFFLYNCSKRKDENIELQIYNDIIPELVNIDYGLIPVPPPPGSKQDSLIYIKKLSEYKKRMDTSHKILFVKDTLVSLNNSDCSYLAKALRFKHVDFLDVLCTHKNLKKQKSKYFNVYKLRYNDIELLPISTFSIDSVPPSLSNSNDLIIGQIVLSRIIFDENYKKGILIYSFFCKNNCGFGQYVLIKKENGKWAIHEKIADWII